MNPEELGILFNPEAEKSVLGAMLINNECIERMDSLLTGDDFYFPENGQLYKAITAVYREGKGVDPTTVMDQARRNGAGNLTEAYVKNILNSVYTSANAKEYAEIVKDFSTRRKLQTLGDIIRGAACELQTPVLDTMNRTALKLSKLMSGSEFADCEDISSIMFRVLAAIEEAGEANGGVTGIATGFADLDKITAGLHDGELTIIGARPSMGKTAFALSMVNYMILKKSKRVGMFSLEMSGSELGKRLVSMGSEVKAEVIRTGKLNDREWDNVMESAEQLGTSKLYIDDTPGLTIQNLASRCRKLKLENNIDIVFIDYIQLINRDARSKADNRQQEISEISRGLKQLSRELDIPVVALTQLNREVELRPNHRPRLSDIRESGSVEQDADNIFFLYRDEYYDPDTEDKNIAEIIIAKQRNGALGTIRVAWQPEYTRFVNILIEKEGN